MQSLIIDQPLMATIETPVPPDIPIETAAPSAGPDSHRDAIQPLIYYEDLKSDNKLNHSNF